MKCFFKSVTSLVAVLTFIFTIHSCSSVKPVEKSQLQDNVWILKSLKGENLETAFTGKRPDLKFDFSQNMLSGDGGCNRYTGGFTLTEENVFSAPNLASTMMACLSDNKESQYLAALSSPNLVVSLTKDGILTFSEGKEVILEFEKFEAPVISSSDVVTIENLAGKWTLASIAGGDIATLFTDRAPSMEFSNEGKVSGNAGCNTYHATYTLAEGVITFGPVMSTKMACPSLQGEGLFVSSLSTPLHVELKGDKLVFLKDENIVLEFTKSVE